jgi:hypothetical protein
MQKNRRWEIALCDRGTVHLHYGTGSLHILKEDCRFSRRTATTGESIGDHG